MKANETEYKAWLEQQPSCISGESPAIAARLTRNNRGGTGFKSLYACVPMTVEEYTTYEQWDEEACLHKHMSMREAEEIRKRLSAKEWLNNQIIRYYRLWLQHKKPQAMAK